MLKNFIDKEISECVNWTLLSRRRMSEEFINMHKDEINWVELVKYQKLPFDVIKEHFSRLDFKIWAKYQEVPHEIIKNFILTNEDFIVREAAYDIFANQTLDLDLALCLFKSPHLTDEHRLHILKGVKFNDHFIDSLGDVFLNDFKYLEIIFRYQILGINLLYIMVEKIKNIDKRANQTALWYIVSTCQNLTTEFVGDYSDNLDMGAVILQQKLPKNFIMKFWRGHAKFIIQRYGLDDKFLIDNKVDPNLIIQYQLSGRDSKFFEDARIPEAVLSFTRKKFTFKDFGTNLSVVLYEYFGFSTFTWIDLSSMYSNRGHFIDKLWKEFFAREFSERMNVE